MGFHVTLSRPIRYRHASAPFGVETAHAYCVTCKTFCQLWRRHDPTDSKGPAGGSDRRRRQRGYPHMKYSLDIPSFPLPIEFVLIALAALAFLTIRLLVAGRRMGAWRPTGSQRPQYSAPGLTKTGRAGTQRPPTESDHLATEEMAAECPADAMAPSGATNLSGTVRSIETSGQAGTERPVSDDHNIGTDGKDLDERFVSTHAKYTSTQRPHLTNFEMFSH